MDREKVIKESEEAIDILAKAEEPTFLLDFVRCAFENALSLLKEQEAMRVLSQRECETLPNHYERKGFCPKCHQVVEWYLNRSYCGYCGQAVKWDA